MTDGLAEENDHEQQNQVNACHNAKATVHTHQLSQQVCGRYADEEKKKREESGPARILSQIGTAVASQATMILLDLAKEKLMEYLQAQAQKKADENS